MKILWAMGLLFGLSACGSSNSSPSKQMFDGTRTPSPVAILDSEDGQEQNLASRFIDRGLWSSGCVDSSTGRSFKINIDFSGSTFAKSEEYFDLSGCRALRDRYPPNGLSPRTQYRVVGSYPTLPDAWVVEWHHWGDDPNRPFPSYGIVVKEGDDLSISQIRTFHSNHPGVSGLLKFHLVAH